MSATSSIGRDRNDALRNPARARRDPRGVQSGAPAGNSVVATAATPLRASNRGRNTDVAKHEFRSRRIAGQVTAELVDNDATRALVRMLPLTIEMRDHLRQEKTGTLPSPLPELPRQTKFSAGMLGLWGD